MQPDTYRFILGGVLVLGLVFLAVFVALGHVEEKTSYGLTGILTILAKVVLDFSEWAFRPRHLQKPLDTQKPDTEVEPNADRPPLP